VVGTRRCFLLDNGRADRRRVRWRGRRTRVPHRRLPVPELRRAGTGTVNQVFDVTDGGTIVGYSGRYVSGSTPDRYRAANDILDLWLARA